jgi:hypothetical protein
MLGAFGRLAKSISSAQPALNDLRADLARHHPCSLSEQAAYRPENSRRYRLAVTISVVRWMVYGVNLVRPMTILVSHCAARNRQATGFDQTSNCGG